MKITYQCKECNITFTKIYTQPLIPISVKCICGSKAIRNFKGITTDKEDDNISHAIELMKYATNPSGKQKTVI